MAIAPRTQSSPPRHAALARKPPTQSVLSLAAYRLADELGGRNCDEDTRNQAAGAMYGFAEKSVETAWSLVDAAIVAVRCYSGRRKVSGARGEVVDLFLVSLNEAKTWDIKTRSELIEQVKTAEGEAMAEIEKKLGELLLRDIPQSRPFRLGPQATAFLLDAMRQEFMPVKGSPLAEEDFPRFVERNLCFLDWLAGLVFLETQVSEYQAKKDADKAARAEASDSPAPTEEEEVKEETDLETASA